MLEGTPSSRQLPPLPTISRNIDNKTSSTFPVRITGTGQAAGDIASPGNTGRALPQLPSYANGSNVEYSKQKHRRKRKGRSGESEPITGDENVKNNRYWSNIGDSFSRTDALSKHILDLQDDVVDVKRGEFTLPVSYEVPVVVSQHSHRLYVEHRAGFLVKDEKQDTSPESRESPDDSKPASTALEFGLLTHEYFHRTAVFCHGLLAGLCLWQCIMTWTVTEPHFSSTDFIQHYTYLVYPSESILYCILVICTISVLDR